MEFFEQLGHVNGVLVVIDNFRCGVATVLPYMNARGRKRQPCCIVASRFHTSSKASSFYCETPSKRFDNLLNSLWRNLLVMCYLILLYLRFFGVIVKSIQITFALNV